MSSSSFKPPLKGRGRSVSPSKREKNKPNKEGGEVMLQSSGMNPIRSDREINNEFLHMLSEMEVPSTLRIKLMSMDSKVKESMMKGQATLSLAALSAAGNSKSRPAISDRLRKSKSSGSIIGEGGWEEVEMAPPPNRSSLFGGPSSRNTSDNSSSSKSSTEEHGNKKTSLLSPALGSSTSPFLSGSMPRSRTNSFSSATFTTSGGSASATTFATMLKATDSSRLDVARVKKMRAVLSSESPAWIGEFVEEGGYSAMLARLNELLNMEWREEQHDDQLLHELLRCFYALSTTDRGRATLQSMAPTPFVELSCLFFSEKRPGELTTRKLLVELLSLLAELPNTSIPTRMELEKVQSTRETSTVSSALASSSTSSPNFNLLFTLLHNPRDLTREAKVDFITASHAPRPFKAFVSELLIINRDYFWVFCHSNRFWSLRNINVDEVECPKVPGGMTGGVEFEAMAYLTSLFRLLNLVCGQMLRLAKREKKQSITYDLHSLLFSSGIDRALATTRKASQVYYQPLHLELARYFDHARQSGFRLPVELEAWQTNPQLLTTEHRYQGSENPGSNHNKVMEKQKSPRLGQHYSVDSAPSVPIKEATSPVITPAAHTSSPFSAMPLQRREAGLLDGAVSTNTGRWLESSKKREEKQPPPAAPPLLPLMNSSRVNESSNDFDHTAKLSLVGPPLPNPHSDLEGEGEGEREKEFKRPMQGIKNQQASMVGTAVKRWEQLANNGTSRQQGGLGLGWAPPR